MKNMKIGVKVSSQTMHKKRIKKTNKKHVKNKQNNANNKFGIKLGSIRNYLKSQAFYRLLVGLLTLIIVFVFIESGATPAKYDLKLGDVSNYDITAPRDIENYAKMEENARIAAENVEPVMKRIDNAAYNLLNKADEFFSSIEDAKENVEKRLEEQGVSINNWNYSEILQNSKYLKPRNC